MSIQPSSSSSNPLERAQKMLRPSRTPKSPLRRPTICTPSTRHPDSPATTSSNLSPSSSSSLSGHGTLSSSTSVASKLDVLWHGSPPPQHPQVGFEQNRVSLPLIALGTVLILVGTFVLRALYTFGTSLLRLFVLAIAVLTILTFSRISEKQQQRQAKDKAVFAMMNGQALTSKKNVQNVKSQMIAGPPEGSAVQTGFDRPSGGQLDDKAQMQNASVGVTSTPIATSMKSVQPQAQQAAAYTSNPYGLGYGHARQGLAQSANLQSAFNLRQANDGAAISGNGVPQITSPYAHEGRTRQLLVMNSQY